MAVVDDLKSLLEKAGALVSQLGGVDELTTIASAVADLAKLLEDAIRGAPAAADAVKAAEDVADAAETAKFGPKP